MTGAPPDPARVMLKSAEMKLGDRVVRWGERTLVMGILNVTPDSFSGDGLLQATPEQAVDAAVAQAAAFFAASST